jgi:hypothetical protein
MAIENLKNLLILALLILLPLFWIYSPALFFSGRNNFRTVATKKIGIFWEKMYCAFQKNCQTFETTKN